VDPEGIEKEKKRSERLVKPIICDGGRSERRKSEI
jgi:hypothetical protein